MNPKKVSFIICVNNELYFNECQYYINRLMIPEGFEVDVISIREASGMAAGYNAAMRESDAKYKVYLHQDVFIINRSFIADMVSVFEQDRKVGLLGCIGSDCLPLHAKAITAWNVGCIQHNCTPGKMQCRQNADRTPVEVEGLDGLLLATQYDVVWREDLFDNWHFYDISQCLEMRRLGYKVVVPYQERPWCCHDNTYAKLDKYEEYVGRFSREYQDIKSFQPTESREYIREYDSLKEKMRRLLRKLIEDGKRTELREVFEDKKNGGYLCFREFEALAEIDKREDEAGNINFWPTEATYEQLMEKLTVLKFALRRIEYGADADEAAEYIKTNFSSQAVQAVAEIYDIGIR